MRAQVWILILALSLLVAAQTVTHSWNCPVEPVAGNSPAIEGRFGGGTVTVYITVCPQKQYYVYYANDGTYRWVWMQLIRVSSVPNIYGGWKHTTGGIARDASIPTQGAGHVCASWYYVDYKNKIYGYRPSTNCVYGPAVPGSTAPNSGEYNVGTVTRTITFQISAQARDPSGSFTTSLTAQWTETIPRIQVSLDLTDPTSVKWRQYIYDGGDSSLRDTWGSMSWDWVYGLTVLALPNSYIALGARGEANFWRCGFACLWFEYDKAFTFVFVTP